ncbi:DUF1801 domain-containing protein [candidate division KSB1 bacterium]|nr:DUF1801 domain-containing protein [candidate division KSB1 bacterium]
MAELKTKVNEQSVTKFLNSITDKQRRQECLTVLEMMKKATKTEPKMWGSSIVGFGTYHYVYASGREGDWFLTGFSPRKQNLTLYLMGGLSAHEALLQKLGKHKTGKGCLYVNKLEDLDLPTLRKLIAEGVKRARKLDHSHKTARK